MNRDHLRSFSSRLFRSLVGVDPSCDRRGSRVIESGRRLGCLSVPTASPQRWRQRRARRWKKQESAPRQDVREDAPAPRQAGSRGVENGTHQLLGRRSNNEAPDRQGSGTRHLVGIFAGRVATGVDFLAGRGKRGSIDRSIGGNRDYHGDARCCGCSQAARAAPGSSLSVFGGRDRATASGWVVNRAFLLPVGNGYHGPSRACHVRVFGGRRRRA